MGRVGEGGGGKRRLGGRERRLEGETSDPPLGPWFAWACWSNAVPCTHLRGVIPSSSARQARKRLGARRTGSREPTARNEGYDQEKRSATVHYLRDDRSLRRRRPRGTPRPLGAHRRWRAQCPVVPRCRQTQQSRPRNRYACFRLLHSGVLVQRRLLAWPWGRVIGPTNSRYLSETRIRRAARSQTRTTHIEGTRHPRMISNGPPWHQVGWQVVWGEQEWKLCFGTMGRTPPL